MYRKLQSLEDVWTSYSILLCDVWGVLHNGGPIYQNASTALKNFRHKMGGFVLLLSNAPRPSSDIEKHLTNVGLDSQSFDDILTSGDLTQEALSAQAFGLKCLYIGSRRDIGVFPEKQKVIFVQDIHDADFLLVTGLYHQDDSLDSYDSLLNLCLKENKPFVCANPDEMVRVVNGDLIPCAGAIARRYESMGGSVVYFGKPFPHIYEQAMKRIHKHIAVVKKSEILAIGDGIKTDILGANNFGIDSLYVSNSAYVIRLNQESHKFQDFDKSPEQQKNNKQVYDKHFAANNSYPTFILSALY